MKHSADALMDRPGCFMRFLCAVPQLRKRQDAIAQLRAAKKDFLDLVQSSRGMLSDRTRAAIMKMQEWHTHIQPAEQINKEHITRKELEALLLNNKVALNKKMYETQLMHQRNTLSIIKDAKMVDAVAGGFNDALYRQINTWQELARKAEEELNLRDTIPDKMKQKLDKQFDAIINGLKHRTRSLAPGFKTGKQHTGIRIHPCRVRSLNSDSDSQTRAYPSYVRPL
eukprot:360295-Chlamydomonas_euryale.AAC.1